MTRFKFCLMGSAQAPVLELALADLSALHAALLRSKYVEGRMVEVGGEATELPVLIPTGRILLVMEVK